MCGTYCDGSCRSGSSTGVGEAAGLWGDVLVGVARVVAWAGANIVAPLMALTLIGGARFVAGAPMLPRARRRRVAAGATWRRGGAKHARSRLHWYAWPGWQRTAVRLAAVVIVIAMWWAPLVTGLVLAVLTVVGGGFAMRAAARRAGPRRVRELSTNPGPVRLAAAKVAAMADIYRKRRAVPAARSDIVPASEAERQKVSVR